MKPKFHPKQSESQGAILITTLIVLTVLAVVAVAFMQSTSMDQLSSRSVTGAYQARLAAEAAVGIARGEVARLVRQYPDSVTVWQNVGGAQTNEATVLYARAQSANTNLGARPGQFGGEITILGWPLVSTTNQAPGLRSFPPANVSTGLPFVSNNPAMINLNATNAGRPEAFVGTRSTATNAVTPGGGGPITAAEWVYIGRNPGPTNDTNPAIARFAYWVEDESFKVNVNVSTNGARAGTSLGLGPEEIRLDGSWQSSTNPGVNNVNAANVLTDRAVFGGGSGFPTIGSAAIAAGLSGISNASDFRFLTTAHSAGLDLSRGGFKRININTITNNVAGPASTTQIRSNLNRIIYAITNSNSVPLFGQRFYRLGADTNSTNVVTEDHAKIYLQKIAVNILDYVDADNQPTLLTNDSSSFNVLTGKPTQALAPGGGGVEGDSPIAAMGVENVPRLYGYTMHARLLKMDPPGYTNTAAQDLGSEFEYTVDHYLEVWNPGLRPVVFGSGSDTNNSYIANNAFLSVQNSPGWGTTKSGGVDTGMPSFERGARDIQVSIPDGETIPAGGTAIITTAPLNEAKLVAPSATTIISVSVPDQVRRFSGTTYYGTNNIFAVRMVHSTRQGNALDAETEILIGNDNGIIESFPYATLSTMALSAANPADLNSSAYRINYSSLKGNRPAENAAVPAAQVGMPASQPGDPRSLNEQLRWIPYLVGSIPDQTRFFTYSNTATITARLGTPNTLWVDAPAWVDNSSINSGANNAPLVVANTGMTSIGEIGHITDLVRVPGTGAGLTDIIYSRGGGHTLRVGQSEHTRWYDGKQTNASRTWTSWRLADIFTVRPNYPANSVTNTNSSGFVSNSINVRIPGLINPNGTLRDNGAAMRAALFGFTFQPAPQGAIGTANRAVQITNVVSNMIARLTNGTVAGTGTNTVNPFWERGEISELSVFNAGPGTNASVGGNMSNTFDRGREELVRRSIEMITTRGSVFTVYAIGQSLQVRTNSTNVLGTARVRMTFELTPTSPSPAAVVTDTPNALQLEGRFRPLTNYVTRIISSFYD